MGNFEHLKPSPEFREMAGSCVDRVLSGKHVLVVGMTGSGKTYWMAKVCERLPCFIFVNPQEERIVDTVTDIVTDEADKVIELLEEGYRRIQFLPDDDVVVGIDQLETIRRDLVDAGRDMHLKEDTFWVDFIIDEIQDYAWLGSRNDLENVFRRGRRYGIRGWALSQQPQNLAKVIVNNVSWQVLFRLGQYSSIYFKNYRIPIEQYQNHIDKDYHYVIYDGKKMYPCNPI